MILIDTHVLIWLAAKRELVSQSVHERLGEAKPIMVSAISCWELVTLASRSKIELSQPSHLWINQLQNDPGFSLVSLSPQMALSTGDLEATGFHGDPADRMIYATALHLRVPLATKDERIHSYARQAPGYLKVECVW